MQQRDRLFWRPLVKLKTRVCEKKKPYEKPNLRVYGDVRTLTQTAAMISMNGDGPKGGLKTQ